MGGYIRNSIGVGDVVAAIAVCALVVAIVVLVGLLARLHPLFRVSTDYDKLAIVVSVAAIFSSYCCFESAEV